MKLMPKGFTLLELLISVTIISILAAIGLAVYVNVQKNGRDVRRQADLRLIQSALEQYRADQFYYPMLASGSGAPCPATGNFKLNCALKDSTNSKNYLNLIPTDPNSGTSTQYSYAPQPTACDNSTTKCSGYCLYGAMENSSNGNSATASCSFASGYNYNVTPP